MQKILLGHSIQFHELKERTSVRPLLPSHIPDSNIFNRDKLRVIPQVSQYFSLCKIIESVPKGPITNASNTTVN